jgi:hypothetical protein
MKSLPTKDVFSLATPNVSQIALRSDKWRGIPVSENSEVSGFVSPLNFAAFITLRYTPHRWKSVRARKRGVKNSGNRFSLRAMRENG